MELCALSAHEISEMVHRGEVSASEVLESVLERASAVDGRPGSLAPGAITPDDEQKVHAFITITADRARAQAHAVDAKIAAGEDPGPLAGVPFSAKDIFCVEGTRSTAASRILAN